MKYKYYYAYRTLQWPQAYKISVFYTLMLCGILIHVVGVRLIRDLFNNDSSALSVETKRQQHNVNVQTFLYNNSRISSRLVVNKSNSLK